MTFSLKVHETKVKDGSLVLTRVRPYARISRGVGEPIIYIQDGQFYTENGSAVDKKLLDPMFWAEVNKMTPEARKAVGLKEDAPAKAGS